MVETQVAHFRKAGIDPKVERNTVKNMEPQHGMSGAGVEFDEQRKDPHSESIGPSNDDAPALQEMLVENTIAIDKVVRARRKGS